MMATNVLVGSLPGSLVLVGLVFSNVVAAPSKEKPVPRSQDIDSIGDVIGDLFRPGVCHSNLGTKKFLSNEICGVNCMFDVDCPASQKCCPTNCGGTMCSPPFIEDPCTSVTCTRQGESCKASDNGEGVCECNTVCPQVYQPMCGSDGKVYSNRCKMNARACSKRKNITEIPCPVLPTETTKVVKSETSSPGEQDTEPTTDVRLSNTKTPIADQDVITMTTKTTPSTTTLLNGEETDADLELTVPAHQVVEVFEGRGTSLFCDAISHSHIPHYMWVYSVSGITKPLAAGQENDGLSVSADGHYLTIHAVTESNVGVYTCMIGIPLDFTTAKFEVKLRVTTPVPEVTTQVPTTKSKPSFPGNKGVPGKPEDKEESPVNSPTCSLPVDPGNCFRRDAFPKWYYDLSTLQCKPFTYTGCGGNDNRFNTYAECASVCPALQDDPCRHPIVTGRCRAHIIRWAFDETTRDCVEFVYGGCGANGNNFLAKEQCATTCFDAEDKKEDCLCVDPNFVDSFCNNHFVLTGHVKQKLLSPGYGALLAVEVEDLIVEGNITTSNVSYLDGPLAVIRDVAQDACQCHDAKADGKLYIIMGYINSEGFAVVDDTSYVKTASEKRIEKLYNLRSRANKRCTQ